MKRKRLRQMRKRDVEGKRKRGEEGRGGRGQDRSGVVVSVKEKSGGREKYKEKN